MSSASEVDPATAEGQARAAAALKLGKTPKDEPPSYAKPESEYSSEEQAKRAKLRAKGVNPDLEAEMDAKVFGKGNPADGSKKGPKQGGFWAKVSQTAMGGGWIK
ncbi:hypothetical protein Slin15195_G022390 [Septoria linicola]|uniref:Uncharacterized protein n=1 Tax=Septoria linicola TaxID=215465 RepID=A0A9Q9AH03_9PEZI|nr:hypothetical protein Slin14017_G021430 [Septoria linicola]USW48920.1 hypothetical protein Slin15195_G022390 [Septoria linicola]